VTSILAALVVSAVNQPSKYDHSTLPAAGCRHPGHFKGDVSAVNQPSKYDHCRRTAAREHRGSRLGRQPTEQVRSRAQLTERAIGVITVSAVNQPSKYDHVPLAAVLRKVGQVRS
jgi:hypothetical protein